MQIKWICPTAPTRPIALFGGFPSTACKLTEIPFSLYQIITQPGSLVIYVFHNSKGIKTVVLPALL